MSPKSISIVLRKSLDHRLQGCKLESKKQISALSKPPEEEKRLHGYFIIELLSAQWLLIIVVQATELYAKVLRWIREKTEER